MKGIKNFIIKEPIYYIEDEKINNKVSNIFYYLSLITFLIVAIVWVF